VTDSIDTAVLAQQRACAHAMGDLGQRHSGVEQLRACHDAVLTVRDPREFPLYGPALRSHHDT
jgi:hypothetical protein